MTQDIAAEIEKQLGDIDFKDPTIQFGYYNITLSNKIALWDKVKLIVTAAPLIFTFIYFPLNVLYIATPITIVIIIWTIVTLSFKIKKIEIDFLKQEIRVVYPWFITGYISLLLRKTNFLEFHEIASFRTKSLMERWDFRRTNLEIVMYDKSPLTLVHFSFEKDARKLGELLQLSIKKRSLLL